MRHDTPVPESEPPGPVPEAVAAGRNRKVGRFIGEGLAAFYREDEEQALACFLDAIDVSPTNLRAHYLAALCAALVSDEEELERICRHAVEVNRRHPYAIACEACRYLYLANFSRAEELFHLALNSLPGEPDLHIGLGLMYSQAGDDVRSAEVYSQVLDLDPRNVRARMAVGMAYALNGEYASALAEYQKAKDLDPEVENPHQHLGRDYYAEGMFDEAAGEFAIAVAEEPDQPAAWFYLMDCYNRRGRVDDALDIYDTIRTRFEGRPELTSGLYEYFHMKREAVAALEEMVAAQRDDSEARYRLSVAYQQADRKADALRLAMEAVEQEPENARYQTWLAELYLDAGMYALAIAACDRAIRLSPASQSAYLLKSDALLYLGRSDEAEATVARMEKERDAAWQSYQARFSGQEHPDSGPPAA